ncbi:UbiD family decarboxylase [Klebsiella pneumoniae]|uniref:UbiD family decarboxylase n=1 Tax=Klebsiella pneumoniae TaxID=573 RepID=UPI001D12D775|nr:UbiD family decarboxylase [Klebsiella pneumoniae]
MTAPIQDLRDAIALLQQHDNQYLETDHPVDPNAELAGVYRHIGAGGTVKRPTRIGPAMMFNNIKGYPHSRILVGMHASRQRAALLLGCEASQLALEVGKAVKKPVAPVVVPASSAPCQEQIFLADDPDFDLRTLLPAPTNTPIDAGPFFCLGLALASDPDDASLTDVTIHRLCVQGRDELSMFLAAGRHIEVFRQKAEAAGKPLPITINMGLDPAIYIGACFEAPTTPFGYNELGVAGALRQRPVELVQGVSVPEKAIARAEIVILLRIHAVTRCRKNPSLPVIPVTAKQCEGRVLSARHGVYDLAVSSSMQVKNIILVDEDVDIFDSDDILWAMTTRMQGDVSITTIPGIRGHQLDPSQTPEYSPSIRGNGISCKTIFDCTVPWALKSHFERAPFADVDPRPFAPEYFARLEKNQGSAK